MMALKYDTSAPVIRNEASSDLNVRPFGDNTFYYKLSDIDSLLNKIIIWIL